MNRTRNFIAFAALAGSLALSPSLPAQTTNASTNALPTRERRSGTLPVEVQLRRLSEQLKLTDEQRPKVKTVLEERNKQVQALSADHSLSPDERRSKARSVQEETTRKMKAVLTSGQFTKYQSLFEQLRPRPNSSPAESIPPHGGQGHGTNSTGNSAAGP